MMNNLHAVWYRATLLGALLVTLSVSDEGNTGLNLDFDREGKWIVLPYAFTSESTGASAGGVAIAQGLLQPQTTMVASVFGGLEQDVMINGEESGENLSGGLLIFENLKVPYTQRLFFSTLGYTMTLPKQTFYLDSRHDSSEDEGWLTSGLSTYLNLNFTYVLPTGEGIENPEGEYHYIQGFPVDREGYGGGMPFVTGRTTMGINLFYQRQSFDNYRNIVSPATDTVPKWNSQGVRAFFAHDNTDWRENPSRGYSFFLQYSKDFGKAHSLQAWDFLEFKASKYYALETFSSTRQNVLAFNFWTAYSFSWERDTERYPGIAEGRPPFWDGPRLGGYTRMRGYNTGRFNDKAALYASAEYRAVLEWNPIKEGVFGDWAAEYVPLDWFQVVGFVEAGRVNGSYDTDLLRDLKYDVGLSLRAFAAEVPVRLDVAYGDEGVNVWVMVKHPFDM
jgi:hypothetical protein